MLGPILVKQEKEQDEGEEAVGFRGHVDRVVHNGSPCESRCQGVGQAQERDRHHEGQSRVHAVVPLPVEA